ncbi:MAG TPA: hypothetical protein VIT67_18580, partial [Povalibacter sp.]
NLISSLLVIVPPAPLTELAACASADLSHPHRPALVLNVHLSLQHGVCLNVGGLGITAIDRPVGHFSQVRTRS